MLLQASVESFWCQASPVALLSVMHSQNTLLPPPEEPTDSCASPTASAKVTCGCLVTTEPSSAHQVFTSCKTGRWATSGCFIAGEDLVGWGGSTGLVWLLVGSPEALPFPEVLLVATHQGHPWSVQPWDGLGYQWQAPLHRFRLCCLKS